MSTELPDPMPENPEKREEIEFAIGQMRDEALAEQENAVDDVAFGLPPQEKLQELGGYDAARLIVGEESATALHNQAVAGPNRDAIEDNPEQLQDVALMNEVMANDSSQLVAEISEQMEAGRSAQNILEDLGGEEEAVRKIGEDQTAKLLERIENEQGEQ